MLGRRNYLRVKVKSRVHWRLENSPLSGEGIVINYSISGIKILLDKVFEPPQESILSIEPLTSFQFTGIKKFKVKWHKKVLENNMEYLEIAGDFI